MLVLAHFLDECAQGECANAGAFLAADFYTQTFRMQPRCANGGEFFGWLFLPPIFQSVPNVNVLMLPHCLGGYFCAQIFRVRQS